VTKEGLEFGDEDKDTTKKLAALYEEKFAPLTSWMSGVYDKKVGKIAFSTRLASTPCVLVTSQYGYSANMERVMKNQAFSDPKKQSAYMMAQKTLELNPRHPIFTKMLEMVESFSDESEGEEEETAKALALLMLDTAMLQSGFTVEDTGAFGARMYKMMASGLSLDSSELLPEIEIPEEPEAEEEDEEDEADDLDEVEEEEAAEEEAAEEAVVEEAAAEQHDESEL